MCFQPARRRAPRSLWSLPTWAPMPMPSERLPVVLPVGGQLESVCCNHPSFHFLLTSSFFSMTFLFPETGSMQKISWRNATCASPLASSRCQPPEKKCQDEEVILVTCALPMWISNQFQKRIRNRDRIRNTLNLWSFFKLNLQTGTQPRP